MKKFLIATFLMFIVPLKVTASVSIINSKIQAPDEASTGEEITVTYSLALSGLDKTKLDTEGILYVVLGLTIDDDVFIASSISSSMNTVISKQEVNSYILISEVDEKTNNKCKDNFLYCGSNYEVQIKYYIKNTTKKQAQISLASAGLITAPVNAEKITDDNISEVLYSVPTTYTLNINETSTTSTPPKDITVSSNNPLENDLEEIQKPTQPATPNTTQKTNTTTTTATTEAKPSRNTIIKKLDIKDAEYNFDSTKNYLEVFISQDLNSLDINVELEDSKSTFVILGADDLKTNDNRVKIEVTAENGQKRTYTLNVKFKNYKSLDNEEKKEELVEIFGQKIKKKYIIYGSFALGTIIILAIIIGLIMFAKDRISNKKYYKALKELENEKE